MNNYFECKVKFAKTLENGKEKKVTEVYLVDAISYSEAESRFIEYISPFISGEYSIPSIKPFKCSEIFESELESDDKYYLGKLAFITLDEKSGIEKETYTNVLIKASDMNYALKNLNEGMKGTMADYKSVVIKETKIMDVIKYNK